jgi:hypothetical protein
MAQHRAASPGASAFRRYATAAALTGALVACGDGSPTNLAGSSPSPSAAPSPTKCCVPSASPDLRLILSATSGPPGTVVVIVVTGCQDPSGQNHAVSFNNDSANMSARFSPSTVRDIPARQNGTRLDATYRIVAGDLTGGQGLFTVQCGPTLRDRRFTVIG